MPEFDENGLFAGLSGDEKATMILDHLTIDQTITLQQLMEATGLTRSQIHAGIRVLREARGCVVTVHQGPISAYKLAEDAPEVRAYALRRMKHWQTQIEVIRKEMKLAERLLGAQAVTVQKAAEVLTSLLKTLELDETWRKEMEQRERDLTHREAKVPGHRKSRQTA